MTLKILHFGERERPLGAVRESENQPRGIICRKREDSNYSSHQPISLDWLPWSNSKSFQTYQNQINNQVSIGKST